MIKRKEKICVTCGNERFIFSKGQCLSCYKITHPTSLKKVPVKQKSHEKKKEEKEYKILRNEYMEEHPFCEAYLDGCTITATECHHSSGRGKNYLVKNTYKAVCHNCHMKITENSKEAIEKGLSQSRLKIN